MSVSADPVPHHGRILNLIHDAGQIIAEHARPHGLATGLEEGDNTGDDGVEGAEGGDEDTGAVAGAEAGKGRTEHNLREEESIDEGGGEDISAALFAAAFESTYVEGVCVGSMLLARRMVDRLDTN